MRKRIILMLSLALSGALDAYPRAQLECEQLTLPEIIRDMMTSHTRMKTFSLGSAALVFTTSTTRRGKTFHVEEIIRDVATHQLFRNFPFDWHFEFLRMGFFSDPGRKVLGLGEAYYIPSIDAIVIWDRASQPFAAAAHELTHVIDRFARSHLPDATMAMGITRAEFTRLENLATSEGKVLGRVIEDYFVLKTEIRAHRIFEAFRLTLHSDHPDAYPADLWKGYFDHYKKTFLSEDVKDVTELLGASYLLERNYPWVDFWRDHLMEILPWWHYKDPFSSHFWQFADVEPHASERKVSWPESL